MAIDRRRLVTGGLALLGVPLLSGRAGAEEFPFTLSEAEWRERLSPQAYAVLREEGTEWAFSSPLNNEHRSGRFHCAGCDAALFEAATKFESGTGWPSFYTYIEGALGETEDTTLGMVRTEVHCANCGGHQGHVFPDGPPPTGLRYCINGLALRFVPEGA